MANKIIPNHYWWITNLC